MVFRLWQGAIGAHTLDTSASEVHSAFQSMMLFILDAGNICLYSLRARSTSAYMTTVRIEPLSNPVCDFCADPHPIRVYAAEDFTMMKKSALPQASEGAWAACKVCTELIDSHRWSELTSRALDNICRSNPNLTERDRPFLRLTLMEIHSNFRKHMRRDV